ncbi:hypothetical protein Drorol1_Dr00020124 [Drosera rotundifolia]
MSLHSNLSTTPNPTLVLQFSKRSSTAASFHPNVEPNIHQHSSSRAFTYPRFQSTQKTQNHGISLFRDGAKSERRGASWGNMGDGESVGERERVARDGDNGRGVRLQAWFSAALRLKIEQIWVVESLVSKLNGKADQNGLNSRDKAAGLLIPRFSSH